MMTYPVLTGMLHDAWLRHNDETTLVEYIESHQPFWKSDTSPVGLP